jgi:hypothetical protein
MKIERYVIVFADRLQCSPRGHQSRGQPAARQHPLANHHEAVQAGKRIRQRLEASPRLNQPALHASLPVARIPNDRGRRGYIHNLNRRSHSRYLFFENVNDRLGDAVFLSLVSSGIIAAQIQPVLKVARGKKAGDRGLSGRSKRRVEIKEAETEIIEICAGVDHNRRPE